ncbi:MAG: alpha-mannosyltransferase [Gammaproteobacteria bacterium]|nr:MAG: alpha-mannosyltransferase [Gammaproteobacteria bacterium]
MRILIVSDTWQPQKNEVVQTLEQTIKQLQHFGHEVKLISPEGFRTMACPMFPNVRLAVWPYKQLAGMIEAFAPEAIHITTEGPLGRAARRWCLQHNKPFTTAYHTRLPEYIHARTHLPLAWLYARSRRFHQPAKNVMVPTPSMQQLLLDKGFKNTALWSRGVDLERFFPASRDGADYLCRHDNIHLPKFFYFGPLEAEKNIEAFLSLKLDGTKWVVGDGSLRSTLEKKYPDVQFLGEIEGDKLVQLLRAADLVVFPCKMETAGLILLQAMACGTPVAAFPVVGPIDVVNDDKAGILDDDLAKACMKAVKLPRAHVRAFAEKTNWEKATRQFERWL